MMNPQSGASEMDTLINFYCLYLRDITHDNAFVWLSYWYRSPMLGVLTRKRKISLSSFIVVIKFWSPSQVWYADNVYEQWWLLYSFWRWIISCGYRITFRKAEGKDRNKVCKKVEWEGNRNCKWRRESWARRENWCRIFTLCKTKFWINPNGG